MTEISNEYRIKAIRKAIEQGDAEIRGKLTIFIHMRAAAAQHHAGTLSQGNYRAEGPGAVFVLPEDMIKELTNNS